MTNSSFSKTKLRSAVVVLSVFVLIMASFGVNNVDAASPVVITSDITSANVMEGDYVAATLTVVSSDNTYRKMEMKLTASWPGGVAWETQFIDEDGDELEDNMVYLGKKEETTLKFLIFCEGACKAGESNTVQVYGQTDPRWYNGGTDSGTSGCSSDGSDCSDTTPASSSTNITTKVSISLTARTGGDHTVECDDSSETGSNEMYQGEVYLWGYDLVNTGWNTDTYTFDATVTSNSGANIDDWTVSPGLTSKELQGQSDSSSTAVKSSEASISITPASTARPGVYAIGLQVTSTNGDNVEGCEFNVVIPEPDFEVKDTDVTFSHTSAWIGTRSDSQRVTIYAKVRNNGGTVDSQGVQATNVDVVFVVDGSQVGPVQTITSLGYGEEVTLQAYWNPGRAHTADEVGIPVKVSVDPNAEIQETEEDNNIGSVYFKVVKTKSSAPSFYVGLLSLVGAVGIAVLLSSYYRNSEEEE